MLNIICHKGSAVILICTKAVGYVNKGAWPTKVEGSSDVSKNRAKDAS